MKLGQCARDIFPLTHTLEQSSGPTFYTLGFLVALVLWAFGLVWLFFASATIVYSRKFPFNIGWWGFTFPLGVFAASTCQMAKELPSRFFAVLGTVSTFLSCFVWVMFADPGTDSVTVCRDTMDYCECRDFERGDLREAVPRPLSRRSPGRGGGQRCGQGSINSSNAPLIFLTCIAAC